MTKRRAVFLDRDGTLIIERDWIRSPKQVRLIRGAARAVRRLNDAGFVVVVLTNQSGVARGYFTEEDVAAVHADLRRRLARHGARLNAIYVCPHLPRPDGKVRRYARRCACRKPAKGMLRLAVKDFDLALAGSFVIGDDLRDLALARGSKLRPILVRTGKGRSKEAEARRTFGRGLAVRDDLAAAVKGIVR